MAKCKVWNVHSMGLAHKEKFRDELIEIPAGQFIEMDYEDAVQFKGQYFPIKKRPTGEDDPAGFKMLKIEPIGSSATAEKAKDFICQMDGLKFPTQSSLDHHIQENYADKIVKDEALEAEIEKEKTSKAEASPRKGKSA